MGKAKGKKPVHDGDASDAQVRYWLRRAPEIRGLRRPGVRMRIAALLQRVESVDMASDLATAAEAIADIDEMLATLGGDAYTDWIEQVPMGDSALQMHVMIAYFTSRFGDLGKDSTSPS